MNEEKKKLGVFPYIVSVISFMTFLGAIAMIFGVIAIIWGLATKKIDGRKLIIIGVCGIAFNIILFDYERFFVNLQPHSSLYDITQGSITYDDIQEQTQSHFSSLVAYIEFYKLQNGRYPDTLEILLKSLPKNSMALVFVFDPSRYIFLNNVSPSSPYFHYELNDPFHYYLLGVGPDDKPYTSDDILPNIGRKPNSGIGLLIHEGSKNSL